MWTYEKEVIKDITHDYEVFSNCADKYDNISNFQAPRGKGGVAILWPKEWSSKVSQLEEGNERIIGIEMQWANERLCIVNTYMPTLNLPVSKAEYQEHIDILHNIITKYKNTHKLILCGDFNATLLQTRDNPHDKMFKNFVNETGLINRVNSLESTFASHNGKSSSQIDYILTENINSQNSAVIQEPVGYNTSSHVHVTFELRIETLNIPIKSSKNKQAARSILKWDKINKDLYLNELKSKLERSLPLDGISTADSLNLITMALNSATSKAVPSKKTKLQGPKFKLSPQVKNLMKQSKSCLYEWKQAGKPAKEHELSKRKKMASKNLRKQLRKDEAIRKQNFLMADPSDTNFYKLIKRNQSQSAGSSETCIKFKGEEVYEPSTQAKNFTVYFEDLATPKENENFNENFYQLNKIQHSCIEEICKESSDEIQPFTEGEMRKSIQALNTKKSPDEFGLVSEHLKHGLPVIVPHLLTFYNTIIRTGEIPKAFKSGILHPIHKKGKDPKSMDNYRGITVTSVFGKLFETLLLLRMTELNHDQSDMQVGFTHGMTPTMAALLLSEADNDSKQQKKPLYLATLDTKKAFDVVDHVILLNNIYDQGINKKLWLIVQNLYTGLTARIKWKNEVDDSFQIPQGVRQGGILSTHFYKVYVNGLLIEICQNSLGKFIGYIYVGCPTCADDVLLMTEDPDEMYMMLAIASSYSGDRRYIIHPQKTNIVCKRCAAKDKGATCRQWMLGSKPIEQTSETTHLGLLRSEDKENHRNIEERISLARRTGYSLMKSGFHGSNGVGPKVSLKIYQSYIIPRLLYSMEVLNLNKTETKMLTDFHVNLLRRIQALPARTALPAVYLLLGALPLEAELHKKHLSLLYSIINSQNKTFHQLISRSIILDEDQQGSFFGRVKVILAQYSLPSIEQLMQDLPTKLQWKRQTKTAISGYWTRTLVEEGTTKSTLQHCCLKNMQIGKSIESGTQ